MNINDFDFNNNQIKKDQKSTIILEQENNKDQNSTILNQHSALITFKIEKGRYFVPVNMKCKKRGCGQNLGLNIKDIKER